MPADFDSYAPFDAGSGANVAEALWRDGMRHVLDSGVLVTAAHPAGGLVPAAGSGRQVTVGAGSVWIAGHWGTLDSSEALEITANSSGSTRVDAIVARCDFVANKIEVDIVTGTPGAGAPALTQSASAWEILLGTSTLTTGGAAVTVADWRTLTGHQVASRMLGEPIDYPAGTVPGWALELNGQAVSRSSYAALFDLWGTTFGNGDGSTTFNVPDRRGRVPVGQNTGDSDFDTVGETGGAKTHTLTEAQLPSHAHSDGTLAAASHGHNGPSGLQYLVGALSSSTLYINAGANADHGAPGADVDVTFSSATAASGALDVSGSTGSIGSGSAHNNLQPYITTRWIVRAR